MSAESMTAAARDHRWSYRAGAISALVLGIGYLATIPLIASVGFPPSGGEASLRYFDGKTAVWWIIVGLSVLTDLLYVPVALSLYLALKEVNRYAMLVATAFVGLFIVLDLAVTWTNEAALISLSGNYAAAANDVQRAAYAAAADYASVVLASHLAPVYAIAILSFAVLMIGVVMLKGGFSRTAGYLALATGILGIASIAGWMVTIILNAALITVWILIVAYRLWRLGAQQTP
jgi:hypothetical protein